MKERVGDLRTPAGEVWTCDLAAGSNRQGQSACTRRQVLTCKPARLAALATAALSTPRFMSALPGWGNSRSTTPRNTCNAPCQAGLCFGSATKSQHKCGYTFACSLERGPCRLNQALWAYVTDCSHVQFCMGRHPVIQACSAHLRVHGPQLGHVAAQQRHAHQAGLGVAAQDVACDGNEQ